MIAHAQNAPPLVELIGATGAGKSTLAAAAIRVLTDRGFRVREGQDAILASYGLAFVRRPKLRSALVHLLTFVSFCRSTLTADGFRLWRLAVCIILRDGGSLWVEVGLLRNVAQRIGVHALLQRLRRGMPDCDLVLCDEGIVQAAHNLFVHAGAAPQGEEVTRFGEMVPRPDLLIWVAAPPEQSAAVIQGRGHPRVPAVPGAALVFAERAHAVFDALAAVPGLREILHRVDNLDGDAAAVHARAVALGEFLEKHCRPLALSPAAPAPWPAQEVSDAFLPSTGNGMPAEKPVLLHPCNPSPNVP
jgi:hypothetical protein